MSALFTSFAQNFEDVLLARCFDGRSGTYVDVGSHHPVLDSTTCAFYARGWRGLNIDALDTHQNLFERLRPKDVNLVCAVGAAPGTVPFYGVPGTGLSTMKKSVAARHAEIGFVVETRQTPVETLATLLRRHGLTDIDFLKIDVEGAERAVMEGMDWRRWRPKIVVVEATTPMSSERNSSGWADVLSGASYKRACFDGLNEYWAASEAADLTEKLSTPANVFDEFQRARERTLTRCFYDAAFRRWLQRLLPIFQAGTSVEAERASHRAAIEAPGPSDDPAVIARRLSRTVLAGAKPGSGAPAADIAPAGDLDAAIDALMCTPAYNELLVWGHALVGYTPKRT